jgi:hypothetical protein
VPIGDIARLVGNERGRQLRRPPAVNCPALSPALASGIASALTAITVAFTITAERRTGCYLSKRGANFLRYASSWRLKRNDLVG